MDGIDRRGDGFARIDAGENIGSNPSTEPAIGELIARRLGRRDLLRGLGAGTAVAALTGTGALDVAGAQAQTGGPSSFTFKEIAHFLDDRDHLPEGYESQVLIRWGDKVVADAPAFDVNKVTARSQALQFGYNCDFIGYLPLPLGSNNAENGLLFVNHEYVNSNLVFAGLGAGRTAALDTTKEQARRSWKRTARRSSRSAGPAGAGRSWKAASITAASPARRRSRSRARRPGMRA